MCSSLLWVNMTQPRIDKHKSGTSGNINITHIWLLTEQLDILVYPWSGKPNGWYNKPQQYWFLIIIIKKSELPCRWQLPWHGAGRRSSVWDWAEALNLSQNKSTESVMRGFNAGMHQRVSVCTLLVCQCVWVRACRWVCIPWICVSCLKQPKGGALTLKTG